MRIFKTLLLTSALVAFTSCASWHGHKKCTKESCKTEKCACKDHKKCMKKK